MTENAAPRDPDCRFCAVIAGTVPAEIVLDDPLVVAFLDHRPLFPGHVLALPRAHHETLPDLPADLVAPLFVAVRRLAAAVVTALDAQGSFVAANNRVSQSVPHLHVHVVPRRFGDGLRGFFWPRQRYPSPAAMAATGQAIRDALRNGSGSPPT